MEVFDEAPLASWSRWFTTCRLLFARNEMCTGEAARMMRDALRVVPMMVPLDRI